MTTVTEARQAVRTLIEGASAVDRGGNPVPLRWQNEDADSEDNVALPGTPAPFVYTEFVAQRGSLISFGGGRGSNLYRNPAWVHSYVFVPKGDGLDQAELIAEQIADALRSYRDAHVSFTDATVHPGGDGALLTPPGLTSDVGNYFWASVEARLFYDLVG